jgi:hypothetical protein
MIFSYSKLLPIRLIKITSFDQRYQNKPFDFDDRQCYEQKFQTDDTTKLQFLSDYDFTFKIYDLVTSALVLDIVPVDKALNVTGQTFKVYEIEIDFNQIGEGDFYVEIIVSDENGLQVEMHQSEAIKVLVYHPETLLYEYRNSYPKSGTIFYDGFISSIRVEGGINDFTPGFDDVSFIDQEFNNTLLDSVSYRLFTLFVGNADGVPDWVGDRLNNILTCDTIKIDGVYYRKAEGAKWSQNRADPTSENEKTRAGYNIQIMPVSNVGEQVYIVEPKNIDDELRMILRQKEYLNNGANIAASGLFTANSLLYGILFKVSGAPLTVTIGLTVGGTEIGSFIIDSDNLFLTLNYPFDGVRTLYIGGLNGFTSDIRLVYLQLDAPALNGQINPYRGLGVGTKVSYIEVVPGNLSRDFNLSTGMGKPDTDWVDWAVMGIYPGTEDYGGKMTICYKENTYPLSQPNAPVVNGVTAPSSGGANTYKLTKQQLPIDSIKLFAGVTNRQELDEPNGTSYVAYRGDFGSSRATYTLVKGNNSNGFVGLSEPMGSGDDISTLSEYVVELMVLRIAKTI